MSEENAVELFRRHRPRTLKGLIGQDETVRTINELLKKNAFPHSCILSGGSGCGKTTTARILKEKLKCSDQDFNEVNASESRGIDTIRDIRQQMSLSPLGGKCRIWLLDEAHKLTGDAQNAMLKMLEDTPNHVYLMLATTDPHKLIPTIRTRCMEFRFQPLSESDMNGLIESILAAEEATISSETADRIIEVSEGSARKAIVLLHKVIHLESKEDQLEAILSADDKGKGEKLLSLLMNTQTKWREIAEVLKVTDEEPEQFRHRVLAYVSVVLLNSKGVHPRAYQILDTFRDNWYDCGKAGLVAACYNIFSNKE